MSNSIFVRENGPFIVKGNIVIEDTNGNILLKANEAYLCRCGQSKNKPFCDGAHKRCEFNDNAQFVDEKSEALIGDESQKLVISVREKAMLIAKGPMTIQNEDNTSSTTRNKVALCCCGRSNKKPFCDTSHKASYV